MAETPEPAPWLAPAVVDLVAAIAASHQGLIGEPLPLDPVPAHPEALAEALYRAPFAVLAHDASPDPCFVYSNLTAQRLWQRGWDDFLGLPSRLSAEPEAREGRAEVLAAVARDGYIHDYAGVRVDSRGGRFRIEGARLWNVSAAGRRIGQAVLIQRWGAAE